MIQKEPFFDDHVSTKPHFSLKPEAFKISPSTDYPLMVSAKAPSAPKSVRRSSREPYYQGSSWSSRSCSSTSSSYAKLSDIFDYGFLDQLRLEDMENVSVFDSDSDYEDTHGSRDTEDDMAKTVELSPKANLEHTPKEGSPSRFETPVFESDSESDLEDYQVHMLTFKVNSRAQYTKPPHSHRSLSFDYFEEPPHEYDLDLPKTTHHPKFTAPPCKKTFVDSVLPSPNVDLEDYLDKCSNGLVDTKNERRVPPTKSRFGNVNDAYDTRRKQGQLRDDFDVALPVSMI